MRKVPKKVIELVSITMSTQKEKLQISFLFMIELSGSSIGIQISGMVHLREFVELRKVRKKL